MAFRKFALCLSLKTHISNITINDSVISVLNQCVSFVEVTVDANLMFNLHCNNLKIKLNTIWYQVRSLRSIPYQFDNILFFSIQEAIRECYYSMDKQFKMEGEGRGGVGCVFLTQTKIISRICIAVLFMQGYVRKIRHLNH